MLISIGQSSLLRSQWSLVTWKDLCLHSSPQPQSTEWVDPAFLQGCPKDETIGFEIELVSFSKTPHWHSMTAQDKIMQAERVRTQGNVAFKLDQLGMARQKYLKGMKLLDNAYDAETDEQVEICQCILSWHDRSMACNTSVWCGLQHFSITYLTLICLSVQTYVLKVRPIFPSQGEELKPKHRQIWICSYIFIPCPMYTDIFPLKP